ncbi:uncharacterized protein RAG0_17645 [Rhynchosporium agropyri]|uniref:Uncharacterized protein n=1 Tax=Rhynchosporium agropyri TaxID=914238 RepID=A0A1E1LTY6_9HELO|nr:uncharacterized protein RAG0_17645 [Rhynchosporium agropyri]
MSNDMRLQCSCSAFFPTSDAFRAHLDEYRTLEGYLSAQLEIYRSHSEVTSDDLESDGHDPDVYADAERPGTKHDCPFKDCDRNESFETRQRLRRHFEQHVNVRRDLAERLSRVESGNNKRAREVGDVGSRTSRVQKAKSNRVGVTSELDFQLANDAHTAASFTQSAAALMPPSNVAEHVARAGFPNISTEPFCPGSIEGPALALDDIDFDAPIFSIIMWPAPWTGWIPTENTASITGSGMR